nr:DUF4270 family protein [uncultured Carboxylicivirga sp.]
MNKRFLKNIFSKNIGQLIFIGLLSLTACQDKPARLSGDVLPDGEVIQGLNEYVQLSSKSIMRESVKTDDADYGLLGVFNDTVFGKTKADFVTDFSIGTRTVFAVKDVIMPPTTNVPFDTTYSSVYMYKFNNNIDTIPNEIWKVDSLVLNLQYQFNDWYGDMLQKQNINIYELSGSLGSNYADRYNNEVVDYLPIPIGQKEVHPNDDIPDTLKYSLDDRWSNSKTLWQDADSLLNNPQYLWDMIKVQSDKDSSWLDSDFTDYLTQTKYWNIKLNDEIAQRVFNLDSATLTNTSAFTSAFPGIYVTCDDLDETKEGNLTRIKLLGSGSTLASNLTIYFSRLREYVENEVPTDSILQSFTYTFPINAENVRFNRYEHEPDPRIDLDDENSSNLYVQGMAGLYSQFTIPDEISEWADSLTLDASRKLEGDPYLTTANIEFFLEVDTSSNVPYDQGGIQRYQLPESLEIKCKDEEGEFVTPTYTFDSGGKTYSGFIFGNTTSTGTRTGNGERVIKRVDNEDGSISYEYYYRFIMNANYFNYLMRELDNRRYDNGWDLSDQEYLDEFHKLFKTEFYIGPNSTTYNFRRVKLFSASHPERPLKMNIKYYHFIPR